MSAEVEKLSPADLAALEPVWAEEKPDRLLTAADLAHRWKLPSKASIYRLAREGRLPAVKLGRYTRFSLVAITEFENQGGTGG